MNSVDVLDLVATRIPMANRLGIQALDLSPTSTRVRLPFDAELANHGGTVHVSAQFAAAETAALAAGLLTCNGLDVTCHSKGCDLRFRKPARGDLQACAQMPSCDPS